MKSLVQVIGLTGLLTFIKMTLGFVIAKFIAVYTGPTGVAMLGQVQSLMTSLNGLINAPVGNGIIRYTAENKAKGFNACSPYWKASLHWVLVIAVLIIPIGLLFSDHIAHWIFKDSTFSWVVTLGFLVLPITALGTLCNSIINGQQLYRRYVKLGMISTIISSTIMVFMIVQYEIKGVLFAAAVQSALVGTILLVLNFNQIWFKLNYLFGQSDSKTRKKISSYLLMAITTAVTIPLSHIIIRNELISQLGWEDAGQWQAVWSISQVYLAVITMTLTTYYLPRLTSLKGVDSIVKEIHKTAYTVVPLVCVFAVLVYISRDIIIALLFTEEFTKARELFSLQLLGDITKIASWLYAYPMISRGATKWFIGTEVIFSCLLVILSINLISYFGLKGANLAYFFNYIFYFIFVFINVKKFSK